MKKYGLVKSFERVNSSRMSKLTYTLFFLGLRPAACTVCDSSFYHEDYLKEHMRLHTGETPFKCPICGRGYAQRCNMKSHLRIHRRSEIDAATLGKLKPNYLRLLKP